MRILGFFNGGSWTWTWSRGAGGGPGASGADAGRYGRAGQTNGDEARNHPHIQRDGELQRRFSLAAPKMDKLDFFRSKTVGVGRVLIEKQMTKEQKEERIA